MLIGKSKLLSVDELLEEFGRIYEELIRGGVTGLFWFRL